MSFWSFFKLIAALGVLAVMVFTAMLGYHVFISPLGGTLGGVFRKIIPAAVRDTHATAVRDTHAANRRDTHAASPRGTQAASGRDTHAAGLRDTHAAPAADAAQVPALPKTPDIDPGEKAYQMAHELLALGKLPEARKKLNTIVSVFPGSSCAPVARKILGEMNLDDILSSTNMVGKTTCVVKRGDSFSSIARNNHTTIDCIMHLNSMMELKRIQPGDELIVMPLKFRLLIEPRRNCLSLWDDQQDEPRFICEYPIVHISSQAHAALKSKISAKAADLGGKSIQPQSKDYRNANKIIQIAKSPVQIRGWNGTGDKPSAGILVRAEDMEEITLLTCVGNEVEFR